MSATPGAVRDGSLSLATEDGPIRINVDKLSPETKLKLGIGKEVYAEGLRTCIRDLEGLVTRLREENATLRRGAAPAIRPAVSGATAVANATSSPHPRPMAAENGTILGAVISIVRAGLDPPMREWPVRSAEDEADIRCSAESGAACARRRGVAVAPGGDGETPVVSRWAHGCA
jgi:hypothetical protein